MHSLEDIKRIAVVGNAGSGKSTVGRKLHQLLHLPLYHLEQYFWKAGWVHPDRDAYKIIHHELCDRNEWMIEGINVSLWDHRMSQAQAIVILKIPCLLCMWRIIKRTILYYAAETPASPPGCHERISPEFFKFLKWMWDFEAKYNAKGTELIEQYGATKQIYVLHLQKEIDAFIRNVSDETVS